MPSPELCPWKRSDCHNECSQESSDDPQKNRAYCWEEYLHDQYEIHENSITLFTCEQIVNKICEQYGIWPPQVADGRGCKCASADGLRINLPRWFREPLSAVHESCHVVAGYCAPDEPGHGPSFIRLLIDHLPTFIPEATSKDLLAAARSFGLEIATGNTIKKVPVELRKRLEEQRQDVACCVLKCELAKRQLCNMRVKEAKAKLKYSKLVESVHERLWSSQ